MKVIQDLRLAFRILTRHPGFTVTALLTLALGIGANIAIFSFVNTVLLRPFTFTDSDRLVLLWTESPAQNIKARATGYATVSTWREQATSFEDLAVFDPTSVTLTGRDEPEQVMSLRVSANLFQLLGVAPALGRTFTPDEVQQKSRVAVISHGLWQRRFAGSQNVLGQTVEIDKASSQVIGVMPENLESPEATIALWEPNT